MTEQQAERPEQCRHMTEQQVERPEQRRHIDRTAVRAHKTIPAPNKTAA